MIDKEFLINSAIINLGKTQDSIIKKYTIRSSQLTENEMKEQIMKLESKIMISIRKRKWEPEFWFYYYDELDQEIRGFLDKRVLIFKEKGAIDYAKNKIQFLNLSIQYELKKRNYFIISRWDGTYNVLSKQEYEKEYSHEAIQTTPMSFEKLLLYPGFRFRIYEIDSDNFGIYIDTKYTLFSNYTLRDEINANGIESVDNFYSINKDYLLYQTCTNFDCPKLRSNECEFSPIIKNTGYRFNGFINIKPSKDNFTDIIDEKNNYLFFSLNQCKYYLELKELGIEPLIEDKEPLVKTLTKEKKPYTFVPERLRSRIECSERVLPKSEDREKIADIINLTPKKRYQNGLKYLKLVRANPGGLNVGTSSIFQVYKGKIFPSPYLKIKNNNKIEEINNTDRIFSRKELDNYSIMDIHNKIKKIKVFVIDEGKLKGNSKQYIEALEERLTKIFDVEFKVEKITDIDLIENSNDAVILALTEKKTDDPWLNKIKKESHEKNICVQGLNIGSHKHFQRKLDEIALGIFSKVGGQPWILKRKLNSWFLGLQTEFSRGFYSLVLIAPDGTFSGSYTDEFDKSNMESYVTKINNIYLTFIKPLIKDSNIVLHRRGRRYNSEERFYNYFNKVIVISDTSIERMFSFKDDRKLKSGSTIFTKENYQALLITTAKFAQEKSPIPKKISSITGNLKWQDIRNIYNLSRLHIGFTSSRIGYPCTLDYTAKCITIENVSAAPLGKWFDKPWFI